MSRSRRKTPIIGNCGGSEKWDKRSANRRHRVRVKQAMKAGEFEDLPDLREISDPWGMNKDGKFYFNDEDYADSPALLRRLRNK